MCGKCGARRVDRQIGLEPTPDAYVQRMVDVFRQVRRVLRADGTCWLNLGDSYNAYNGNAGQGGPVGLTQSAQRPRLESGHGLSAKGLKPKDLVGIPWRVAFALQQPYYTGRIKDERDRIWLAAMVEAEGCMFIHRRGEGQYASSFTKKDGSESHYHRKNATYGSGLEVASTDRALVARCLQIAGKGSIGEQNRGRKRTLYRWMLRSNECRDVIRELYPHMIAKQHEARLLIGCPSSGPQAEAAWQGLKEIHHGGVPAIDFAPPESLLEPGWYVRSDIVWSKLNPMPESVTDRPTKAHEYLFMLTRSPRYFYDADAISEPADWERWGDQTVRKPQPGTASWIKPKSKQELVGESRPAGRGDTYSGFNGRYRDSDPAERKTRNARSVWNIATQPYAEAHFATFPEELPRRCIAAGTSERGCCPECGAPWERETATSYENPGNRTTNGPRSIEQRHETAGFTQRLEKRVETTGWRPSCDHGHAPVPCSVLDPFMGSGTTALVARKLGRRSVGIELNPEYAALCARRLQQLSLLAEPAS